jgi:hypothetical protein
METKNNKYDTNPLDPDVERASQEVWGDGGGKPTSEWVQQPTGKVEEQPQQSSRKNVYSEAPTRRYDSPPLEQPYPSVFVPTDIRASNSISAEAKYLSGPPNSLHKFAGRFLAWVFLKSGL